MTGVQTCALPIYLKQRSVDDLQPLDASGLSTEIVPVVARVNDLLSRLDHSVQAQKQFIGHAAHQLRPPLAGLKLDRELMLARKIVDQGRSVYERVVAGCCRIV